MVSLHRACHFLPVELTKAYRRINHGPTVLVSSAHGGVENVMAASWARGLDASPPKGTLVVDSGTKTRESIERSTEFVLQVPTVRQAAMTHAVGNLSLADEPAKLVKCGVELFRVEGRAVPFVAGCAGGCIAGSCPALLQGDRPSLLRKKQHS